MPSEPFEFRSVLKCFICDETLVGPINECPKCGCPTAYRPPSDRIDGDLRNARQRVMEIARLVPVITQTELDVDQLIRRFLWANVSAVGAIAGFVWNLDFGAETLWAYPSQDGLEDLLLSRGRESLLCDIQTSGPRTVWFPVDSDENQPADYLLIMCPFRTPAIPRGIVEIVQRPGAPAEAADGYLQFLGQMCVYLERSTALQ